jgi:hypothetical protein
MKEILAKPEPKFTLPPLPQRINQMINTLDNFSAAPAKSQLDQIALIRTALADTAQKIDKLIKEDVASFNKAVNEAQSPAIYVPR